MSGTSISEDELIHGFDGLRLLNGDEVYIGIGAATDAVVFVAVVASGACGGAQSPSKAINRSASPTTSATPAPRAAPGAVSDWQAKGAAQVPPQSVQQVTLAGIEVVNQTNGAVSQSD